eukprot:693358-Ditylum_brightwellii.AAC.1
MREAHGPTTEPPLERENPTEPMQFDTPPTALPTTITFETGIYDFGTYDENDDNVSLEYINVIDDTNSQHQAEKNTPHQSSVNPISHPHNITFDLSDNSQQHGCMDVDMNSHRSLLNTSLRIQLASFMGTPEACTPADPPQDISNSLASSSATSSRRSFCRKLSLPRKLSHIL